MIKYAFKIFAVFGAILALNGCKTSSDDHFVTPEQTFQPGVQMPTSIVICREKQCAPAKLSMSREYIYNSLTHLLENNAQEKALICQANPLTHVCTEDYVTLPITVGVTPANLYLNDVQITDVSLALNHRSLELLLNYGVSFNGQKPTCKPAESLVYVKNTQNIVLEDSGYTCKMTTIGNTTIKTLFTIDYIDLDYGFIGGYYSIGLSGPAYGGGSGYMIFKLKNNAYPLSPDLILKEEAPKNEAELASEPFVGTECFSTTLEPMPCYEEWPCYNEPAVGKVICPEPEAETFYVLTEDGKKIERSRGVISPKAINNVKNQKALNTKDIQKTKTETTTVSAYDTPASEDLKGTEYKGVEVFPIYKKKK